VGKEVFVSCRKIKAREMKKWKKATGYWFDGMVKAVAV